jgi:uncharacterized protein YchJ
MGKLTKKQHYISQCILANFANSKMYLYEALVEIGKVYKSTCENALCENLFYEHSLLKENSIEHYFQKIENDFGPTMKELINLLDSAEDVGNKFIKIKVYIKKLMQQFIIFYYRSGALAYEFSFERKTKDDRILMLIDKIADISYIRNLGHTIINYYSFCILKSEHGDFILSDQYVSTAALSIKNRFFQMSNRNIGLNNTILLIPISCYYYLCFYNGRVPHYVKDNLINDLTEEQVDEINAIIINNSYVKSIGYKRESLERALAKSEYSSPVAIYGGSEKKKQFSMGATSKKEVFFYIEDKKAWELFVDMKWGFQLNLNRNDPCFCGSGEKYKNCCYNAVQECKRIYSQIVHKVNQKVYVINENATIEKSISEFYN